MKTRYQLFLLVCAAGIVSLLSSGCYTQFGVTRDDRNSRYDDQDEYASDNPVDTTADYDSARQQFYDDNYYPEFMFGVGFYDAWRYRGWNSPYAYWDPYWGWCGTSYPGYYGWWGHSGFGYGPSVYGHANRSGYGGFAGRYDGAHGATRTFGSTRTSGDMRGGSTYAPGGTRTSGSYTTPAAGTYQGRIRKQASTVTGRNGDRPVRIGNGAVSRRSSRVGSTSDSPRSYPRSYPRSSGNSGTRTTHPSSPPPSSGGSGGHSGGQDSGRGGSSAPSSHSGGGSAPANSGNRGGNRR